MGLSDLEIRLYLTLLPHGSLTAVKAADLSGIHRPRAYDELKSLERKGLVVRAPTKPIRYTAISPQEALSRLVSRLSAEYSKRIDELSDLADDLTKSMQPVFERKAVGPSDIAWIVSGARNIKDELNTMLQKTKKQFFASYDPGLDLLHRLPGSNQVMEKLHDRGVKFMFLFNLSDAAVEHAEGFRKLLGPNIKFGKRPFKPLGIYVREGKQALIAYQSDQTSPTYDVALNLVESPLTTMLSETMMIFWARGVPFTKAGKRLKKKPLKS